MSEKELIANESNIFASIKDIINTARNNIARTVNSEMVNCYWNIGKYIYEAQGNKSRADYGTYLIKYLSERLTKEFGKGFSTRNLLLMKKFYEQFPLIEQIVQTVSAQFNVFSFYPLLSKLTWSHISILLSIDNETRRNFYIKESIECNWSVRQLERQIHSFYYERLLASQDKETVKNEINITEPDLESKINPLSIFKDPYVLEFLNMKENKKYLEKELESKIINNLQDFILELGKGFTFVGRQKRITIDGDHYYIDLVFYNVILKCYVLIDLKIGKVKHQDMGQMDMYINYFDKEIIRENDNPTIGIVLCTEKNTAVVKYSTLNDNKRLFISKYMDYLPTEKELTDYVIQQSELFTREQIYIEDNNKLIIIDCGFTVFEQLKNKFDFNKYSNIFAKKS